MNVKTANDDGGSVDGRKKKASKTKKKGTKANNKEAELKKVLTLEEQAELEYQEQI